MKRFLVLFEESENGYSAYVPDLPGCVAFGDTKEETEELIHEAISFHLEGMKDNNLPIKSTIIASEYMEFA